MDAESREAVFVALRKQGIKAIKVVAADGSKANGEIRGVRKRVLAASVVSAAILTGVLVYSLIPDSQSSAAADFLTAQTRRQVVGDLAVIEKGIKEGWASIFPEEGERFLASFAIPGVPAGQRNTTEAEIRAALSRTVEVAPEDGIEARQIKAMVEGMKDELRGFVKAGGTIEQYGRRLVARQDAEIAIYNRTSNEIEQAVKSNLGKAEIAELVDRRNEELRRMGIKPIQMPEVHEGNDASWSD